MTDWSVSSDPYKDSDQDRLGSGKSERQYHSANWAMKWLKNYLKLKICTARPQGRSAARAGEMMCSFWELQST